MTVHRFLLISFFLTCPFLLQNIAAADDEGGLYAGDYDFVTEDGAWCWFSDPRAKRAVAREALMNEGRKTLDWDKMRAAALDPEQLDKRREEHKNEEVCAMCGKFCAVKMLRDRKTNA